jgi:cytoskeletal protein RodZ
MGRTNQGGSILSYIIVGGVLALLLIGGVYFIRQQAAAPQPIDQPTPATDQQVREPAPEQAKPEEAKPETSMDQSAPQQAQQPAVNELPQTGPAESIMALLALGSLTAVMIAYMQSRRHLSSL